MNKITASKCFLILLAILLPGIREADAAGIRRVKALSIYDEPKYEDDFSHFAYVNPEAPQGGRVVLPEYGGFDNFNPFIFKGIPAPAVAGLTLDSLGIIPVDDESTAYPLIAKEFELPDDRSFVGFILDEKAKFSDGSPVTADDVIFSYKALVEKGSPFYKVYYADVERAEKVNDRQVRFYFRKGAFNKELPLILAQIKIYSAKDWQGRDFATPTLRPPLGSGPYLLDKFAPGKYLVFKKNPDYWAQNIPSRRGFFNFDEIRYDYYQDTTVTLQALFAGNIDIREEYIAKIWVSGYDNELVKSGQIIKEEIAHNQPAVLQYFGFNTRLPKFSDKRVREAVGLAFNFDWANDKLFYNQYKRIESCFANTGMEASGLPQGKELEILNRFRNKLPESVFAKAPKMPEHRSYLQTRENLRRAVKLLQEAGYDFRAGKMTNLATGEPFEIEVLGNSANGSSFTRVMLPFIENLKKIGIKTTFRNLETNIFKNRLDNFDFEIAILGMRMSNLPGNELKEFFGSAAANVRGSYNIMGIQNETADELIKIIIASDDKTEYREAVRALDRVILNGHYMIPQWYSPHNRVAYRRGLRRPKTEVAAGYDPFTWWRETEDNREPRS